MKIRNLTLIAIFIFFPFSVIAEAFLEIDINNEIDLKDGTFLAKEYEGQGRYAYITHSHGRFEGGDIGVAEAACTDGFLVSKLPAKFKKIRKALKPNDYVLTKCNQAN
jgi:hypothetical protein